MVHVVTRAPNITNISCWKIAPNHSCILIQESFWITIHLFLVKQFKIESSDIFQILDYFQISIFILPFGTSLFGVLPLCFRKSHYFKKLLDFSTHLLIPA